MRFFFPRFAICIEKSSMGSMGSGDSKIFHQTVLISSCNFLAPLSVSIRRKILTSSVNNNNIFDLISRKKIDSAKSLINNVNKSGKRMEPCETVESGLKSADFSPPTHTVPKLSF